MFDEKSASVIVTVTVNVPSSAYVWLPLTVKGPPVAPLIVPAELSVSPQLIVAVYSAAVAAESGSVKPATAPENGAPSVALMFTPVAAMGASQVTVTSLLSWVFPRLSTKLARSVSVPGFAPAKLNDALPEAFAVEMVGSYLLDVPVTRAFAAAVSPSL